MKNLFILLMAGGIVSSAAPTISAPPEPASNTGQLSPVLVINLTDGSRLRGTTNQESFTLRSETLGTLSVPLHSIRTVKLDRPSEPVTLMLQNGDRVQGVLAETTIALATLFGIVTLPLEKATSIEVRASDAANLDWEILPFPEDSDWPGPRGELARVTPDEIVLNGQPVWTKQAFSCPLIIKCEVMLDALIANDGAFNLALTPADAPPHLNTPPNSVIVSVGYTRSGGFVSLGRRNLNTKPFYIEPGKAYQLTVEVMENKIQIKVDDQTYDVGRRLEPTEFRIKLNGWQPGNTWRVRHFTTR